MLACLGSCPAGARLLPPQRTPPPHPGCPFEGKSLFPALGTPRADTGSVGREQSCSTPQKWGAPRRQSPAAATSSTLHKPAQAASVPLAVSPWVDDGCIEARAIRPRPGQAPLLRVNEGTGGSPRLPREGACSWLQPSSCSLVATCCPWSSAGQQRRRCCMPRWIDSSWI